MSSPAVIRIKPYYYIHVLDNNKNVTRVEIGPQTFTRQDHEKVVAGPTAMIMVPPRHYCIVQNPVVRDAEGSIVIDRLGQIKISHGDEEIRFEQEPFPLYPGEKLYGKVSPLQVVAPNTALKLRCIRDCTEGETSRVAGDEWLFEGPGTYMPRVEVQVVEIVRAKIVLPNQALRLRASKAFTDRDGTARKAGEEWLVRASGAFLPGVEEQVTATISAYVLTEKKALHLQATRTFVDVFGKERKAGEEWLVTIKDAETHIPDVYEKVVGEVKITTLTSRQYSVIVDPIGEDGKPQMGKRILKKGEVSFFLRPGERLESGIQNVHVLDSEEALLLRAREGFTEGEDERKPGDRWMIYGPCDYVPPTQVEIMEKRRAIPLDENEGIYVRDLKSGRVRAVTGTAYMLSPYEELWSKTLPDVVETLIAKMSDGPGRSSRLNTKTGGTRDKTRVVTYRTPHNAAVQIYDYKAKKSRVVFGPELVMLGPDEHFSVLSLSGDKPKRPHVIKALHLLLGPDFMTDIVIVETSDHARLSLKLSYNWHFEVDREDAADSTKLFSVPDFVGDACKAIASRVRGSVAAVTFDDFHKNSALIIREAVFGKDAEGVKNRFSFSSNNLFITNIDIQSVEPVDQRTRDALQKSVQLAIEITTKSQEAAARHEAERREQEARGRLERQKINDEAEAEKARTSLIELQAKSAVVEASGQATAEARARAAAAQIEGEAAVKQAELQSQANSIRAEAELAQATSKQEAEIAHQKALNELEIQKARDLASIEGGKFKGIVDAIGADTIKAIAQAGPEMQVKLLQSLGLKGYMITSGDNPINLFQQAGGFLGAATGGNDGANITLS